MKDYSKMSDFEINKDVGSAVGYATGIEPCFEVVIINKTGRPFDPCNNPADAWPIITKRRISLSPFDDFKEDGDYIAAKYKPTRDNTKPAEVEFWCCDNPLRAAMIVFLMMQEAGNV